MQVSLNPDIPKRVFAFLPHLNDLRLINNRAMLTSIKGVNELAAEEQLGRILTNSPFIQGCKGLRILLHI